jgi:pimeloyl-ACP methyl ester carboxylesterase
MLKEQSFKTKAVSINYAEGPASGPPLVLLHGIISRWQYFLPLIPTLWVRWHIYALDFRGHGKSGRVKGQYQLRDYVKDTVAFMRNQLTEPAVLFGHSLGGAIALIIAAKLPRAVRAVVVGDTPLCLESLQESMDPNLFVAWRNLARSGHSVKEIASGLADTPVLLAAGDKKARLGDLPGMDAAFLEFEAKSLSELDSESLDPLIGGRMFEGHNEKELLSAIFCPVLLLQGNPSLGAAMTDRDVESTLSILPHATHVRIEDAGHELHLNHAESIRRAVTYFLESLL